MVWDIISVVMSRGLGDWDSIVGLLFVSLVSVSVHVHSSQFSARFYSNFERYPNFVDFFGAREPRPLLSSLLLFFIL